MSAATWQLQGVALTGAIPAPDFPAAPYEQPISMARGTDGSVEITVYGPDGQAADITGGALVLGMKNRPTDAEPLVSREGVIVSGPAGTARFPVTGADTLESGLFVGPCSYDVWLFLPDFGWQQVVPASLLQVLPINYLPGGNVTPGEPTPPLAQGPQGPQGEQGIPGPAPAGGAEGDFIVQDSGGDPQWATLLSNMIDWSTPILDYVYAYGIDRPGSTLLLGTQTEAIYLGAVSGSTTLTVWATIAEGLTFQITSDHVIQVEDSINNTNPGLPGGALTVRSANGGNASDSPSVPGAISGVMAVMSGTGGAGNATHASGASANLILKTGSAGTADGGPGNDSGDVVIDCGPATGAGTAGRVSVGETDASGVDIGRVGIPASAPGGLQTGGSLADRPAAGAEARGLVFVVLGAPGVADEMFVCLKSSTDTYSWVPIVSG